MKKKTKHREWVKTAAIVFLAVMLVLTFFSRTILNRSLAEVATQRLTSGTITARIRGTGTVQANEVFELTLKQDREIRSVPIVEGQEIKTGDVLFLLEGEGDEEIKAAEEELRKLNLQYDQALIQASSTGYASQNYAIQVAREKLDDAIAERDALYITDGDIQAAGDAVNSAQAYANECQAAVDRTQQEMALYGLPGQDAAGVAALTDSLNQQLSSTRTEIVNTSNQIETNRLLYGTYYDTLEQQAYEQIMATAEYIALTTDEERAAYLQQKLPVYLPYAAEQYKDAEGDDAKYYEAYNAIQASLTQLASLQQTETLLEEQLANAQQYQQQLAPLLSAQETLSAAQQSLSSAQAHLEALISQQANYNTACSTVKSLQQSLQSQILSLQTQQAADARTGRLQALQIGELLTQIERQEEKIGELRENAVRGEVVSPVDGIVKGIHFSPGQTAPAGASLATVELPAKGYHLQFSVTAEQASMVNIGSEARVSNYFWGDAITASLDKLLPDPEDPMEKKLLVFRLYGDGLSSGATLSLTVAQKSAQYDLLAPNSAVRSDANGSFVLVLREKHSALGTRYTARRVDVTVLAQDDTHTAVRGGLEINDFVITTSSKPISNGSMVKMASGS